MKFPTDKHDLKYIHDSFITNKSSNLFNTYSMNIHDDYSHMDSSAVDLQLNKHCMTELKLLDDTKVLATRWQQ